MAIGRTDLISGEDGVDDSEEDCCRPSLRESGGGRAFVTAPAPGRTTRQAQVRPRPVRPGIRRTEWSAVFSP